jgi:hypothetical protein
MKNFTWKIAWKAPSPPNNCKKIDALKQRRNSIIREKWRRLVSPKKINPQKSMIVNSSPLPIYAKSSSNFITNCAPKKKSLLSFNCSFSHLTIQHFVIVAN